MACIENMPPANADSEMEEGEIVDELDYLSDISSEEEFLLRQRLQVLENYNNVLERKKAKSSPVASGKNNKHETLLPNDLSDISNSDNEEILPKIIVNKNNNGKFIKQKKRKEHVIIHCGKEKETKKKSRSKKKVIPKVVSESSEESDDEYKNKRRKLADAVVVHTPKSDTTSLSARLKKMFGTQSHEPIIKPVNVEKQKIPEVVSNFPITTSCKNFTSKSILEKPPEIQVLNSPPKLSEFIDLCNDESEDVIIECNDVSGHDTVDSSVVNTPNELESKKKSSGDSDEDLELLRQHALKTKGPKKTETKPEKEEKSFNLSEDEDSDTAELRLICLKSALLKKAIEMKRKQKLRKRLSQSLHEDIEVDQDKLSKKDVDNNTDIESVDMDIGSDGDDKLKEIPEHLNLHEELKNDDHLQTEIGILSNTSNNPKSPSPQREEIDDDEDLLRAKLLTSLSKNWPNLIDPQVAVAETASEIQSPESPVSTAKSKPNLPEAKPFIIKLGDSDSEEENEATKNLKKMHMKLSEQVDFQQKLDQFLKSTRLEVEKQTLPDVVQKAAEQPKPAPKFVAKTVRHLPKSEQIEYKNLVRRMAELEKIKQARQTSMNLNKTIVQPKETLKPRNVSLDARTVFSKDNLEEQIAASRKKIAEESVKMLKLKEEATKLSQKYKIAATELRNISTAITLNKKEQRSIQNRLTKIRLQHQTLLQSSTSNKHSKTNMSLLSRTKMLTTNKLQKENNPSKTEFLNTQLLKAVKVSVVNDIKDETLNKTVNQRLSIQVDVSSNNKKIIKIPNSPPKERVVDVAQDESNNNENIAEAKTPIVEKGGTKRRSSKDAEFPKQSSEKKNKDIDDYKSPLDALHPGTWEEDPNSFLCPFEVGGTCKDPDCKYIHPKIPTEQ